MLYALRQRMILNYDYLVSNGKLYVRYVEASNGAMYQDGLFPNFPYQGDFPYELSQWTTRGNLLFSNEVIGFDKEVVKRSQQRVDRFLQKGIWE